MVIVRISDLADEFGLSAFSSIILHPHVLFHLLTIYTIRLPLPAIRSRSSKAADK